MKEKLGDKFKGLNLTAGSATNPELKHLVRSDDK